MPSDDLSLEALFNQGGVGDGSSRKVGFVPIDTAGAAAHRTAVTVTSTAQQLTITAGKRSMEIQNTGTNNIYIGGSGVDSDTGIKLFPNQGKAYLNIKDSFSIYVVCADGEESTLRIVEYA